MVVPRPVFLPLQSSLATRTSKARWRNPPNFPIEARRPISNVSMIRRQAITTESSTKVLCVRSIGIPMKTCFAAMRAMPLVPLSHTTAIDHWQARARASSFMYGKARESRPRDVPQAPSPISCRSASGSMNTLYRAWSSCRGLNTNASRISGRFRGSLCGIQLVSQNRVLTVTIPGRIDRLLALSIQSSRFFLDLN